MADLFVFFSGTYVARSDNLRGAPVHDPCAVLGLTHPHLFQCEPAHVAIETRGRHTRGMTVIDQRHLIDRPATNCTVQTDLDADAAWAVIVDGDRPLLALDHGGATYSRRHACSRDA